MNHDKFTLVLLVASLFQLTFLHGFGLLYFIDRKRSIQTSSQILIFSFIFGFLINYFLFFGFTILFNSFHFYFPLIRVLISLFAAESSLLAFLIFAKKEHLYAKSSVFALMIVGAALLLAQSGIFPVLSLLTSDEPNSYLSWAVSWSKGEFPAMMNQYGQVISMAWSAIYDYIRTTQLEFAVKCLTPIFPFYVFLMLKELHVKTKNPIYLLSIFTVWLLVALTSWQRTAIWVGKADSFLLYAFSLSSLNIDFQVTTFAFIAFCCLLLASESSKKDDATNYLIIGQLCSFTAILTKQAGAILILMYPLAAYFLVVRKFWRPKKTEVATLIGVAIVISILVVLPHHILNELTRKWGINDRHNLGNISSVMNMIGITPIDRIRASYNSLIPFFYWNGLLILFLILGRIGAISGLPWFLIGFGIVIPYSLIWMVFVSYEITNLTLVFPFLGLLVAGGIIRIIESKPRSSHLLRVVNQKALRLETTISQCLLHFKSNYLFGIYLVLLIILNFALPLSKLQHRQDALLLRFRPHLTSMWVSDYFLNVGRITKKPFSW
jgi:hypothetical protein